MLKTTHNKSTAILNGYKKPQNKVLDYETSTTIVNGGEEVEQLKANYAINKITLNNNLDLYRKWMDKTIEATKYFNYYNPKIINNQRPIKNDLLNYDLSTVDGLEKKFDLEDGEIFTGFYDADDEL